MSYWKDLYTREQQYLDMRRDAAKYRWLARSQPEARKSSAIHPMLAWLGRRLMVWGLQLNARYGS